MEEGRVYSAQELKQTLEAIVNDMRGEGLRNCNALLEIKRPIDMHLSHAEAYMGELTHAVDAYSALLQTGALNESEYREDIKKIRDIEIRLALYLATAYYDQVINDSAKINSIMETWESLGPELLEFAKKNLDNIEKMKNLCELVKKRTNTDVLEDYEQIYLDNIEDRLTKYMGRYTPTK